MLPVARLGINAYLLRVMAARSSSGYLIGQIRSYNPDMGHTPGVRHVFPHSSQTISQKSAANRW